MPEVKVHALLDGRDTPPSSALGFVQDLEARLGAVHPGAAIASVGGRYYAMDRDNRWERTERGYDAIVHAEGLHAASATGAIEAAYARGETDEFVAPTAIDGTDGALRDGDPIVHFNFRADRARQLTHALAVPDFASFDRTSAGGREAPHDTLVVTMSEYEGGLPVLVAFGPEEARSLAQAFSEAGWTQFHVAETEKYAHVTYFFNGGVEAPWPGEERRLVPSPKVATYDLQPAMSAAGVTDELVAAIASGRYDFIVANFANPDMVGHTGVWGATTTAIGVIDGCLGRILDAIAGVEAADPDGPGAVLLVTADHGNADAMIDDDGRPVTKHSLNPVPLLADRPRAWRAAARGRRPRGRGAHDPRARRTCPPWDGMTGRSLLRPA